MRGKKRKTEELIQYLNNELDSKRSEELELEIKSDQELQQLFGIMIDLQKEQSDSSWEELKQPAHALFDQLLNDIQKENQTEKPTNGILTYDSKLLPLPEGVRPAAVDTRKVKYNIGDLKLEISLYPISSDSFEMIGQVDGWNSKHPLEIVLKAGKKTITARANQFQVFRFSRIEILKYKLTIISDSRTIGVIEIEL